MTIKTGRAGAARLGLIAAVAAMLLPGTAAASSIAFIKDHNVWLTSPDGSRQQQVTSDGTATTRYRWPSQADDGTILAKRGDYFVRLRPDGTRLGAPVPAVGSDIGHSGNLMVLSGPSAPRISPDGTRFAYWLSARSLVTCPIWDPHCSFHDTDYTLVSRVDRFTRPEEYGAVRDYRDPSWIGNDRLLVSNYGLGLKEGAISRVGTGEAGLLQWFDTPAGVPYIGQGELSRRGDRLATLAGTDPFGPAQEQLYLYGVPAAYPTLPVPRCYVDDAAPPSRRFLQPSWSPDGTELAVGQSDGIHVFGTIPDLRAATVNCAQITERVIAHGSEPAWGPADVPGAPTSPQPTPPSPPAASPMMSELAVAKRQKGRVVRVRLRGLAAGATVRVRLLGRPHKAVMGSTVKRAAKAGALTLRVRLNRPGRTALRHRRRLRLSVHLTVTAPGAPAVSASRRVTLRR
jgi:hypothetical protein